MLISPAKKLDMEAVDLKEVSQPRLLKDAEVLIKQLKKYKMEEVKSLMHLSDNLAELNLNRYKEFSTPFTSSNAKPAARAFMGDVYVGLDAAQFNKRDFNFAQKHLRILSGLYGLLKPLDLMQAYRLEMGTKLKNKRGKNLYEFWGTQITDLINEDLKAQGDNIILNLASNEYFKSVKPKLLEGDLYTIDFKEDKNGTYKVVSFFAKKARGMFCNYVIKNKIKKVAHLKGFDYDGYTFNASLSQEKKMVFTR